MKQKSRLGRPATEHHRTASRLLGALSAAVLSLGFLTALAPASSAATGTGYVLTSGNASFTARGHIWHLQLTAQGGKLGAVLGASALTFSITSSHLGGTEEHSWVAKTLPARDLSVSKSGHATFKTGSRLKPVLTVSLTFSPTSHSKISCSTGSGTRYSGRLSGSVSLTAGVGRLKVSKKLTFSKPNSLQVTHACVPPTACDFSGWAGGNLETTLAAGTTAGLPGHQETFAVVERTGVKTASKYLVRSDGGFSRAPAPRFNAKAKSLKVAGSTAGLVTGAGVLSHAIKEPGSKPFSCVAGGKKFSETEASYVATFASTRTFQARTLLTGTISVSKSGSGFFTIDTLKRK